MNSSATSESGRPVLMDGHVHFHSCFREARFLDSAAANLQRARRELGLREPAPGLLLFTESGGDHFFRRFRDAAGASLGGGWVLRRTDEETSLLAEREDGAAVTLVAGRQVTTADGLEVLALALDADLADGRPLEETLAAVRGAGAPAAVPWGFGKWWRGRGDRLARVMEEQDPAWFFLGDNGGRPRLGRRPGLFGLAERLGIRILPGSDPLPFPDHVRRVGSYGCLLRAAHDPRRPAASLRSSLADPALAPQPFGCGQRALPFLRNQLAMQWRKRLGRAA